MKPVYSDSLTSLTSMINVSIITCRRALANLIFGSYLLLPQGAKRLIYTMLKSTFVKLPPKTIKYRSYRNFNHLDSDRVLENSLSHVNSYNEFDSVMEGALNKFAPMRSESLEETTRTYLLKMRGTTSLTMTKISKEIWEYLLKNGITITAEYLPGCLNVKVDWESRNIQNSSEWKPRLRYSNPFVGEWEYQQ